MLIENLKDVASHSSLHGVKFLADSRRWYQRLFWISALSVCAIIALDMVRDDWLEWNKYPVDVTAEYKLSSSPSVFIPAITVCDDVFLDKASLNQYLETGNETAIHEVLHFCKLFENTYCSTIFSVMYNVSSDTELNNETISRIERERIFEMFKNFISPSDRIRMKDKTSRECDYFIFTTLGRNSVCHTKGLLPMNYVYMEKNLAKFITENFTFIDEQNYFSIELDPFIGLPTLTVDDGSCDGFTNFPSTFSEISTGFKLKFFYELESILQQRGWDTFNSECKFAIHSPWDVPSPFMSWQPCESFSTSDTLISFKVDYTVTDSDVETAKVVDRDCLFPHEKPLSYFLYYSHKNCLFECVANMSADECGCVTPDMPNTGVVDFCEEAGGKSCVEKIVSDNAKAYIDQAFNDICGCLPLCNNIDYVIIDQEQKLSCEKHNTHTVHELRLIHHNYYNRHLTDDVTKFLLATMTTLDMFLGFSVVSILELMYFLMVIAMRWFEEQKVDHKEKQRLRKESTVSNNNWCTMCQQLKTHEHVLKHRKKSAEGNSSSAKVSGHPNFSEFLHDSNFIDSGFDENCSNCRKFNSSASNVQLILLLKKEIRKEIGEQLAGFVDYKSLSEIKESLVEIQLDIHDLKRKTSIWE